MNVFILFSWMFLRVTPIKSFYLKSFALLHLFLVRWSAYYFFAEVLDHAFYLKFLVDKYMPSCHTFMSFSFFLSFALANLLLIFH